MTRTYSGGNLVLRLLGRYLEKCGFEVKIYPYNFYDLRHRRNLFFLFYIRSLYFIKDFIKRLLMKMRLRDNPFGSLMFFREQIFPVVSNDTIAVYSEGVYGNPLRAQKVVRWFLYHNRFPSNPEAYGKDDLFFSFREHFNDYNLNPTCRLLTLLFFDKDLYKRTNFGKRDGVCYIIRKGKNRSDLPPKFDGPVIDDFPEKEKVSVLNRCKYCYDYDTQTFYSTIAAVCGCIPVIVMEPGKSKSDYLGAGDNDWGKAYGDSAKEIEHAINTRDLMIKSLDFEKNNEENVDYFINEVEKAFGKDLNKK